MQEYNYIDLHILRNNDQYFILFLDPPSLSPGPSIYFEDFFSPFYITSSVTYFDPSWFVTIDFLVVIVLPFLY